MNAPAEASTAHELATKRCLPCSGATPKLSTEQSTALQAGLEGWRIEGDRLLKTFKHRDFLAAMKFLNRVAEVAEAEQHHPDFAVHYSRVDFTIWTHEIGGLSENDFVLAAKIDQLSA